VTNLSGGNIYHKFVEGMHSFHSEYKEITNTVFSNDQLFSSALDEACAEVLKHHLINTGQHSKSHPTLLAKYCDFLLKKSTKGVSDTEVDDKLTQCITVFKYIDDKDVFEKFYSRLFAIRLIQQQSQSMDAEEAMVGRLKLACVYEFTNKLHRMLTDMSVSSDLNNRFNQMNDVSVLGLNFSIYVLQSGAWPRQVCPTDFAVPQELEKSIQEFEDFYRLQFNGRKLTWLHNLSYGELKLNYLKKRYFITMGTFQMAILLVFQKTNSLTCGELMEATKLNSIQFQNTVKSLVKSKLLAVSGDTVEVFQPCTVISLNMDYSNQRTKFRINNSVKKETFQETETTHSSVNEDRKLHLQVRILWNFSVF
jgi:cullin 2